jgi:hypothetical protein
MSVKLTARVWALDDKELKDARLLTLLALADFANDCALAWPSVPTLAQRTRICERQVQRAIHWLVQQSYIEIAIKGNGRGNLTTYKVTLKGDIPYVKGDIVTPFSDIKGDMVTPINGVKGDIANVKGDIGDANQSYARREPLTTEPERESAPARVESPREPAGKVLHVKSPHLDPRRFVNGYIPTGRGINPIEVYYERFSINQDVARLNPVKEDDLARLCPDLDKLREVVTAYSRTQFQLGNLQLILDWYRDGIPQKHQTPTNGASKNGSLSEDEKAALRTAARLARSSLESATKFKTSIDPSWQRTIEKAKAAGVL